MGEGYGGVVCIVGQQVFVDCQVLLGFGVVQVVWCQVYVVWNQFCIEVGLGLLLVIVLVQGGGDCQQFDVLFDQGGVGVWVLVVGVDQYVQVFCWCIQYLQVFVVIVVEVVQFVVGWEYFVLWLVEWLVIGIEGQVDVVQLVGVGMQFVVFDFGVGQDDGVGDYCYFEIMGEFVEQGLVVVGYVYCFYLEQGVGEMLIVVCGDLVVCYFQWVVCGYLVYCCGLVGSGVDFGFFVVGYQLGVDMFGEYYYCVFVEQVLVVGIFQVGVEFQL